MIMKKIVLFTLGFLALGAFSACSGGNKDGEKNSNDENRNIQFESYSYDLIGEFSGADSVLYDIPGGRYVRYIGQGVLPKDLGQADVKHLRDTLMKIARVNFVGENRPEPTTTDSIRITDLPANDSIACGEVIANLSTTLVNTRVIVWENEIYSYPCMAAHGMTNTSFINFCMTDGKIMSLSDLFRPGYEKKLKALIAKKLKEAGTELLVDRGRVPVAEEFEITTSGILFSYDPYQIAPYSEGTVQVELTTDELLELLSDHGRFVLTGVSDR